MASPGSHLDLFLSNLISAVANRSLPESNRALCQKRLLSRGLRAIPNIGGLRFRYHLVRGYSMGLFSKKKAEPSLFETMIVPNSEWIWGWLPGVWYQDLQMKPLQESDIISKKQIDQLSSNLFPVQGQGEIQVPADFEANFGGVQLTAKDESSLRELFAAEFSGTTFHLWDAGVLTLPIDDQQEKNSKSTALSISFHKGKDGTEFGYVYVNLGFFTWPFSSDYIDPEISSDAISSIASGVSQVSAKVRAPLVMATLMATSEAAVLGAKKNFDKAGRIAFADKKKVNVLPKPKFRVLPTYPLSMATGDANWVWGYMPEVLQAGWTFTAETLKDEASTTILGNAPILLYNLFSDGCRNWPEFMDQIFGTPAAWASDIDRGVLQVGDLRGFMERFDYNGSPNSLAYSFWLPRLAEGKLSLSALEKSLHGMADEEGIIAEGNLSLANLMHGNFEKAEELALSVLKAEPENCEAVYVLESLAEVAMRPKLREVAQRARSASDFEEYSPPAWLTDAVANLAGGTRTSSAKTQAQVAEEFLDKLTEQFIEFVRVIDKLEFAQFFDAEGIRPAVSINPNGDGNVGLFVFSPDRITFRDFPWLAPENIYDDIQEFDLPRAFFADQRKLASLLADIFEFYNQIEIEIAPLGYSIPKIKTLFPVAKKAPPVNPGLAAAAAGVGVAAAGAGSATYTPKFFFAARTEEVSTEEPPSFDWF